MLSEWKVKLVELYLSLGSLSILVFGNISQSGHFLANIGMYNLCFQIASFSASNIVCENYIQTFKVPGQLNLSTFRMDGFERPVYSSRNLPNYLRTY